MKKKRFAMLAVMLLTIVICILMTGCGSGKARTESQMKRVAENELEKKYGEEFVVHDVWMKNSSTFFALCSPKVDSEIDFKADIYLDNRGIYADGYVQGLVAKQIDDNLHEDFRKLFEDCYTRAELYNYYKQPQVENVKEITIKEYMAQIEVDFVGYDVFILLSDVTEEAIEEEYRVFSEVIQKKVSDGDVPHVVVDLYFVDENALEMIKEYYASYEMTDSEFEKKIKEYPTFYFAYSNGQINQSYQDYKKFRMGIIGNE